MLTVISCPECGVPAEITDRFSLPSTDGPVAHVATSCAAGHHFRMPTEMLNRPSPDICPSSHTCNIAHTA